MKKNMSQSETKSLKKKEEKNDLNKNNSISIDDDTKNVINEKSNIEQNEENDLDHRDIILLEKNLHNFFNEDLIKALNNDSESSDEKQDSFDFINNNGKNSWNCEFSSKEDFLESNNNNNKQLKIINKNSSNNNFYKNNKNYCVNTDYVNNNIKKEINYDINNIDTDNNKKINYINNINNDDINNLIKRLNDPLFAPIKINNELEEKEIKENEEYMCDKGEKMFNNIQNILNNSLLNNKVDDDFEQRIIASMINLEEYLQK